jgi:hypothetical protein
LVGCNPQRQYTKRVEKEARHQRRKSGNCSWFSRKDWATPLQTESARYRGFIRCVLCNKPITKSAGRRRFLRSHSIAQLLARDPTLL